MTPSNENSNDPITQPNSSRIAVLIAVGVMWIAVTQYFIAVTAPMNPPQRAREASMAPPAAQDDHAHTGPVIPAASYNEMKRQRTHPTAILDLAQLSDARPETVAIQSDRKASSLAARAVLRSYNGAPPTIPHPVDQLSAASCMACHGEGLRSVTVRAAKAPHPYYANCTQCHVEQTAPVFPVAEFRANRFAGLAAPTGGPRAFETAPPATPHSTWLRNDCLACHGRTAHPGLRTSHPARRDCLQCHPSSSQLEQSNLDFKPQFLPPIPVEDSND